MIKSSAIAELFLFLKVPQSFIDRIVEEVQSQYEKLDDLVFITPSRRSGTFLKHSLARSTDQTFFSPEILSIEKFVEQLSGISYATNTELLFTLYYAYLEVIEKEHEEFVDFSKWGRTLLMDFDEIDRYLLPQDKILNYLSAITEVNHWYLKKDKTALMQDYIAFWHSLEPMYQSFTKKLLDRRKGHQGLVYRKAFENLEPYLDDQRNRTHIFLGFNAFNEAEARIVQALLKETPSKIYWDIDRYFIDSAYHDAGYFVRQHIKNWPYYQSSPFPLNEENYLNDKSIQITGIPKNVSQAKQVAQLLEKLSDEQASGLDNTAVVLGDESLLNPLLNSLPLSIGEVNITMGYPLRNSPLAGLFNQLFDLFLQSPTRGWPYKKVLSFLSLPQIQLVLTKKELGNLKDLNALVLRRNLIFITHPTINDKFGEVGTVVFNRENEKVSHFINNALRLIELIKTAGSEQTLMLESAHLFGFYAIFNQLSEMTSVFPYVNDIRSLHGLFLELLAEYSIDFQGEPLRGLQIMGMLESRVLDFETVIITSVNEGVLPSGKQVNSFIPYDVKKEFGLPTFKEKDAVYTYHFYRLLQRAKNIHLLYNTEPDVLVGGEPSRLIHQLITDKNLSQYVQHRVATMHMEAQAFVPLEVIKDPLLMEAIEGYAKRGFSPSSLSQYIRDPLVFYKQFILNIDESEEVEESIAAKTFGTIIHNSLEELLAPFLGKYLEPDLLKSLKPKLYQVVKKHFTSFYEASSMERGRNSIAFQVLIRSIKNYLDYEIKSSRNSRIRLLGLEKKLEILLEVPGIGFPVKLKGKIDRIDECDGKIRIIDYKTGRVFPAHMNVVEWEDIIREPNLNKAFQVMCYALMSWPELQKEQLEGGIISFKNMKEGFLAFATKEKKASRTRNTTIDSGVIEIFREQLYKLIIEICNPRIPIIATME